MRDTHHRGLVAGPLVPGAPTDQIACLARVDAPLLVVVDDYAEARRGEVIELLTQLAHHPPTRRPRRLVLNARVLGDWWTQLHDDCPDGQVRDLLGAARIIEVGAAEESVEDRVDAYYAAIAAYAPHTGPPVSEPVVPDLADRLFETLLFVHMAALSALPGGDEPPSARSASIREELLARTLAREQRYWAKIAKTADPPLPIDRHVRTSAVAVATLAASTTTNSPADLAETAGLLEIVADLAGDDGLRRRVAWWLRELYRPRSAWIAGLEPDLLGEALVAQTLKDTPRVAGDLLARATSRPRCAP